MRAFYLMRLNEMKQSKFLLFFAFFFALTGCVFGSDLVCDFDANQKINTNDAAVLLAYLKEAANAKILGTQVTIASVQDRAQKIIAGTTVSRLPEEAKDDLGNASVNELNTSDAALLLAYLKEAANASILGTTVEFSAVESRAANILGTAVGAGKFPGTEIGDSTVPITITGITTD